jgi:hypothetical protein
VLSGRGVAASLVLLSPDGCRFVRTGGRVKEPGRPGRRPEGVLDAGGREPIIGLAGGSGWQGWAMTIEFWLPQVEDWLPFTAVPLAAVIPSRGPGPGAGGMGQVASVVRAGRGQSDQRPRRLLAGDRLGGGLAPGRPGCAHPARAGSGRQRIWPSRSP